jgi:hypothetical protein
MKTFHISFITPLFSKGSYEHRPEIRPASIRGQLHWWFRVLGGSYNDEKKVFGGIHNGTVASPIVIRISQQNGKVESKDTLPHKSGGQASPKSAFAPGASCTLHVVERLGGVPEQLRPMWDRTLEAWLLAGSLGLRATRGGGSIKWDDAPSQVREFTDRLVQVFNGSRLRFDLLEETFGHAEEARKVVTETIAHAAFKDIRYPLGAVKTGKHDDAPRRKTSPLRLTIRQFEDGFKILALWDDRTEVTHNSDGDLRMAINRLANGTPQSRPTKIGRLLANSKLAG